MQITLSSLPLENLRIAESSSPMLRVVEIPSGACLDFLTMPELRTSGIYLLLGEIDDESALVAVGAADDLGTLLGTWAQSGDTLHTRLLITGRFGTLTAQQLIRLESRLLQTLKTDRLLDRGLDLRIRPTVATDPSAESDSLYQGAISLLKALGLHLFETKRTVDEYAEAGLYYCSAGAVRGQARRTSEGFVVLKGSVGQLSEAEDSSWAARLQQSLRDDEVLMQTGAALVFSKDHVFNTPAQAASVLTGRVTSGFFDWKTLEGRALGEIERYIDAADEPQST